MTIHQYFMLQIYKNDYYHTKKKKIYKINIYMNSLL